MRQLSLSIIYILLFALFGCSQKYGINKSYAFTRTQTAGTVPVNDNNRPQSKGVKKIYLIYLEVVDTISKPQWDTAWIEDAAFSVQPLKIEQDSIFIGTSSSDQKKISLTASAGYFLWQLLLTPISFSTQRNDIQDKTKKPAVTLSGTWKGKEVNYKIKEITELERIFME
ncbi:MAG: hypothetical protein EOP04_02565 [Proteobacteria bacterium]|nr:MAG: hypothetical protein EOP04_02565 [Pseudomonadota bacterium]